MAAISQMSQLH